MTAGDHVNEGQLPVLDSQYQDVLASTDQWS